MVVIETAAFLLKRVDVAFDEGMEDDSIPL
jgi:hypothetical protein